MKALSRKLGNTLLEHHRFKTAQFPPGKAVNPDKYTIYYSDLCERAGVSEITAGGGQFLAEVAEWCSERQLPPLNSLAVSLETRMPGEGYDGAPGSNIARWPAEVEACIRCTEYPQSLP